MRLVSTVSVAIILGLSLGAGTAYLRIRWYPWDGPPPLVARGGGSEAGSAHQRAPRVEADATQYDFGVMNTHTEREHTFVFRNEGNALLTLAVGDTTCRCTFSQIEKEDVKPGESTKVTVHWSAADAVGPYQQTARIMTNDPVRPSVRLTIVGRVTTVARTVPTDLAFSRIVPDEESKGEVRLYGYVDQPLEIRHWSLADTTTADHFTVETKPLTAEQLKEEQGARSGVLATVSVKPGLPQGPFQQTIRFETNLEAAGPLEVLVRGRVVGDLSVVGRDWESEEGVLFLGPVSRQSGAQRELLLLARGPHRDQVKFELVKADPAFIQVRVGESKPIQNDSAVQTPVTIEVPKGSPAINRLGSDQGKYGEVILATNHPKIPKLRILISFAVEE